MSITRPVVANPFANAASGTPDIAIPTYLDSGFPAPGGVPVKPPRGYFNWLFNWAMQAGRYLLSRGISEWDATETQYTPGSVVLNNDFHHWALMNGGTATTGTRPDADTTNWARLNVRDRANLADYGKEAGVWRNDRGQRGDGFDYWGFFNGNTVGWDEQWDEPELQFINSTGATFSRRWWFRTDGSGVLGGILSSNNPQYVTAVEGSRLLAITWIPTGGAADIQLRSNMYTAVFNDDITAGMFWSFMLPPSTPSTNCTFVMGFNAGGTRVGSITNGAYLYKTPGDVNWQFVTVSGGVSSSPVDTGIVAASGTVHRGALVLTGANRVDLGGVAKAVILIDGTIAGTITTHLPYTTGGAGAGLPLSPVFGIVTTATASPIELRIGPVRYRQNIFPGDVGVV